MGILWRTPLKRHFPTWTSHHSVLCSTHSFRLTHSYLARFTEASGILGTTGKEADILQRLRLNNDELFPGGTCQYLSLSHSALQMGRSRQCTQFLHGVCASPRIRPNGRNALERGDISKSDGVPLGELPHTPACATDPSYGRVASFFLRSQTPSALP